MRLNGLNRDALTRIEKIIAWKKIVILRRFCTLQIFGKEGLFQGITREIRIFQKYLFRIIFRK